MIVVRDEDHSAAIQKLEDSGFIQTLPDRRPAPEIMESLPNPQAALDDINEGYKRLDRYYASFQLPDYDLDFSGSQIFLIPNSFAHLPLDGIIMTSDLTNAKLLTGKYEVYGNLYFPLEAVLVESFVKAAVDENDEVGLSSWEGLLRSWISLMSGYLEVNNDILDNSVGERVVEWYSTNFGRIRETRFGPIDRRVTKRLGSRKEMPVDMRGNSIDNL